MKLQENILDNLPEIDKNEIETQKNLKTLKNEIEIQESNYKIESNKKGEVIIIPANDEINKIKIKNINGDREISHGVEGIISDGDLIDIKLDESKISNDQNINKLQKILQLYELPNISDVEIIEISIIIS